MPCGSRDFNGGGGTEKEKGDFVTCCGTYLRSPRIFLKGCRYMGLPLRLLLVTTWCCGFVCFLCFYITWLKDWSMLGSNLYRGYVCNTKNIICLGRRLDVHFQAVLICFWTLLLEGKGAHNTCFKFRSVKCGDAYDMTQKFHS